MQLFANNADSELNGAITSVSTSITLKTGGGAKFPTPTGGDFFLVTLFQKVGITELNHEIVKCTARSGDVLTVVRAQEGTTGFAFSNADLVELRWTSGSAASEQQKIEKDATGGYAGLTLFKINFKNVANTFTSFFTNSNTAARTYTFQNRDGTIADNTDLAAKQATLVSATNIKTVNGTSLLGSGNLVVSGLTVVPVSGTTQTAVAGNNYVLNNVAATAVTMPTTLVAGDPVTISPNNGLLTNTVDFGAKTVRFGANTMTGVVTLDLGAPMQLVAIDTTTWMWL